MGFPGVRGGCWRLGRTAVTRGPHHRGLPAAPGSQFHSFSHFLFPQVTAKEQLFSVRKTHFHSLCSVLLHLPWCGRGCVPPWNQARGPPAATGAGSQRPGILGLPVLCPRTGGCSEVDAWVPRARASGAPLWGLNAPGIGLLCLCISASLSATLGSWGLRVLVCGIQTRSLVGSLRFRVPDLALGARSRFLSPGLSRRPRPNPLSPGSFCSLWPRGWPSGPPTLQTWARFRSPARSLPPPLARCRALTWRLSSQLRVIFFLS